jgi:hypothetical protein
MSQPEIMTFEQFAAKYCERQEKTPEQLKAIFEVQRLAFEPDGWMMLECGDMCSSRLGQLTVLPYGGKATYKTVPDHPVSPRGRASDMSMVVALLPVAALKGE